MASTDSPSPVPLSQGFSKLETLPEGFAEGMRHDCAVGDIIGERYRIVRPIGHGAMGKVFLAENLAIGLRVAVKLLKPELLANPDFRLRFKHEAEAVAAIQHPNVARFFDLVVGDPTFLVMEFVEGPTLHEVIAREGRLPPRRAVDLAIRLAWGLDAAHRANVVHRDLKPGNILLQPNEECGEVPKIIDFGLAKIAAAPGAPLTRAGQIIGTPQYMAPEQIVRKQVDARSDIYALASVLYAMLCGRPPFLDTGDDVQLLYRQVHEPVLPVRDLVPEVSPELEYVVLRALEKDPDQRFQTARDFARALVPSVEKRSRRPPPSVTDQVRLPRRSSGPILVGLVLLAAALAGVGGLWWRHHLRTRATLLVISDPDDAVIELDGRRRDHTPAALDGLTPGDHRLRLHHDGYTDLERPLQLEPGGRAVVDVHLSPRSHTVELVTVPSGATVFLDGILVAGQTPMSFAVTDGEYHALRVEKAGYETVIHRLKPDDTGELPRLLLEPEKQPRGTLFVESNAPTKVFVDGEDSGFMAPTPGLRVSAGEHVVSLREGDGRVLSERRVQVRRGETVRLALPSNPTAPRRGAAR